MWAWVREDVRRETREAWEGRGQTHLVVAGGIRDGCRLHDGLIDALDQHPVPCGHPVHLHLVPAQETRPVRLRQAKGRIQRVDVPGFGDPESTHLPLPGVFFVLQRIVLSQDADVRVGVQRAAHHAAKDVEASGVLCWEKLRGMHHQRPLHAKTEQNQRWSRGWNEVLPRRGC